MEWYDFGRIFCFSFRVVSEFDAFIFQAFRKIKWHLDFNGTAAVPSVELSAWFYVTGSHHRSINHYRYMKTLFLLFVRSLSLALSHLLFLFCLFIPTVSFGVCFSPLWLHRCNCTVHDYKCTQFHRKHRALPSYACSWPKTETNMPSHAKIYSCKLGESKSIVCVYAFLLIELADVHITKNHCTGTVQTFDYCCGCGIWPTGF